MKHTCRCQKWRRINKLLATIGLKGPTVSCIDQKWYGRGVLSHGPCPRRFGFITKLLPKREWLRFIEDFLFRDSRHNTRLTRWMDEIAEDYLKHYGRWKHDIKTVSLVELTRFNRRIVVWKCSRCGGVELRMCGTCKTMREVVAERIIPICGDANHTTCQTCSPKIPKIVWDRVFAVSGTNSIKP